MINSSVLAVGQPRSLLGGRAPMSRRWPIGGRVAQLRPRGACLPAGGSPPADKQRSAVILVLLDHVLELLVDRIRVGGTDIAGNDAKERAVVLLREHGADHIVESLARP